MIEQFFKSDVITHFNQSGVMGLCITAFALVLYWQVVDVLFTNVHSDRVITMTLLKVDQLLKWVTVAPLLGLLGTVSGLMDGFSALSHAGGHSLSDSVARALLTTEMGLAIAIPAWVILLIWQRHLYHVQHQQYPQDNTEGVCVEEA